MQTELNGEMKHTDLAMNIFCEGDHDLSVTEAIRQSHLPVIIYGRGSIAMHIARKMANYGLQPAAYAVDDAYVEEGAGCLGVSECNAKYSEFILLRAFFEAFYADKQTLKAKFPGASQILYYSEMYGYEAITQDDYRKNKKDYDALYECLEDDLSRQSYEAFLNAKINSDARYLWPHVVVPQYTPTVRVAMKMPEPDFLKFRAGEVFVNCGAFDGDTIKSFLRIVGDKCRRIYAIEPDRINAMALRRYVNTADLDSRVQVYEVGVSNAKGWLHFKAVGKMKSCFQEDGDTLVEIETIDNITAADTATFINMDIEGAELDALKGAARTLSAHKPTLAISIYHKRSDCLTIPRYIKSLVPEYKLYFVYINPLQLMPAFMPPAGDLTTGEYPA